MLLLTSLIYVVLLLRTNIQTLHHLIHYSTALIISVFTLADIVLFYIALELTIIPLYFIMQRSIAIKPYRLSKINRATIKLVSYTLIGSFLVLLAILAILFKIGSSNYIIIHSLSNLLQSSYSSSYSDLSSSYSDLIRDDQVIICILLFVGFGIKVPIFPFHVWLPEARGEAPTGGSVLLAGLILKLAGYGLIRLLVELRPHTLQLPFI